MPAARSPAWLPSTGSQPVSGSAHGRCFSRPRAGTATCTLTAMRRPQAAPGSSSGRRGKTSAAGWRCSTCSAAVPSSAASSRRQSGHGRSSRKEHSTMARGSPRQNASWRRSTSCKEPGRRPWRRGSRLRTRSRAAAALPMPPASGCSQLSACGTTTETRSATWRLAHTRRQCAPEAVSSSRAAFKSRHSSPPRKDAATRP